MSQLKFGMHVIKNEYLPVSTKMQIETKLLFSDLLSQKLNNTCLDISPGKPILINVIVNTFILVELID